MAVYNKSDRDFALKKDVEIKISRLESSTFGPKDIADLPTTTASLYEDNACKKKVTSTVLARNESKPSKKLLYLKSDGEGVAGFTFTYGGNGWGASMWERYLFEKRESQEDHTD